MIGTLAKAGFSYISRFFIFLFLAIVTNVALAISYFGNITAVISGEGIVLGVITIVTIIIFPIIWFFMAKQEALLGAIFKIVDRGSYKLVEYSVDNFITRDNQGKVGDHLEVLNRQPKVTRIILEFFFEKIDFFGRVGELLKEKDYTNQELKLKMVETIEEKELFEEWEPSFWTPVLLLVVNIGVLILASQFL